MDEEWCRKKLESLQIKDLQLDTLTEIKEKLNSNPQEVTIASSYVKLPAAVFACVENGEEKKSQQTELACDVLAICMSNLNLEQADDDYGEFLEDLLKHSNENIQMIALNEIERVIKQSPQYIKDAGLIIALTNCLGRDSTKVGTTALKLLPLTADPFIEITSVKESMENILNGRDIAKCRCYEFAVKFAVQSIDKLQKVDFILTRAISDLDSDDTLLQMNIMEILSDLAATDHGLDYLENKQLFSKIPVIFEDPDLISLLFPGFVKIFGSIANSHPDKIFTKYSYLGKPLFDTIYSNDSSTLSTALDTFGLLGASYEGKIGMHTTFEDDVKGVLMEFTVFLHTLPTEEKIRALNCLELFFKSENVPDNKISAITEQWYKYLARTDNDLSLIIDFCRNPFPDIKLAALGFLRSIVSYQWGRGLLMKTAGLIEYLLDRQIEFHNGVFQAKYDVVKALHESGGFEGLTKREIARYVQQGAFYVEGITEVALEGARD